MYSYVSIEKTLVIIYICFILGIEYIMVVAIISHADYNRFYLVSWLFIDISSLGRIYPIRFNSVVLGIDLNLKKERKIGLFN